MSFANNLWRSLFMDLALAGEEPILFRWHMKNGAVFQMFHPEKKEIGSDTFSKSLEFPFSFEEIAKIEIEDSFCNTDNFNEIVLNIESLLKKHPSFLLKRKKEISLVKQE